MTWGQEILRALLLTLGATEIITNSIYLAKANGIELARKQHGELPPNLADKNIRIKVLCMFVSGIALFGSFLASFILHQYLHNVILISTLLFSIYGIIEALYYKYWKTIGFAILTIILFVFSLLN